MSYFDLDDILADEQETTVVLKTKIFDLGHLDRTGNKVPDLEVGTKLSLPLWLSLVLFQQSYLNLETPKVYGKNFCSKIAADPKVMNMGVHSYWYEVGTKVVQGMIEKKKQLSIEHTQYTASTAEEMDEKMRKEEEIQRYQREIERLTHALRNTFAHRYVDIFQLGQNCKNEDMSDVSKKYCVVETRLFHYQQQASTSLDKWKNELSCKLEASELSLLDDLLNEGETDTKKRKF